MKSIVIIAVLWLGISSLWVSAYSHVPSKRQAFSVPFKLTKGLMLVSAQIDGQKGDFIIDTGCDASIINSKYYSEYGNKQLLVKGFTGEKVRARKELARIRLGVVQQVIAAIKMDLTHLEEKLGRPVHGIIGIHFLKNFVLTIEYAKNSLHFNPINLLGKPIDEPVFKEPPFLEIPLTKKGHLLVLALRAGEREWNLGIDTGASLNLIGPSFLNKATDHFSLHTQKNRVSSLSDSGEKVQNVLLMKDVHLQDARLPSMRSAVKSLTQFNSTASGRTLHGILGYEFLKNYRVEIHFQTRKLHLWQWKATPDMPVLAGN